MKRFKRILLIVLVALVVLLFVACAGGYWFITKSHPQVDGTLRVPGLQSRVEVVRDAMGVPHIYASNVDDLFFAQGYVQAQDRLWQMEYNRRVGHGTLSEMFGATTIRQDRFLRTMGLGRAARADAAALSAEDRRPLEAFARGVTGFIELNRNNLPLEFAILGTTPAPWQPVDTIAWGKVMAYNLSGNFEGELLRAALIEKLGATKAQELIPPYPATGPFIIPPEVKEYKSQLSTANSSIANASIGVPDLSAIAAINATLGLRGPDVGSNNWVVGGAKTTTGKPLLANDPHLAIQMPSIWYVMGLHCVPKTEECPYNVAGFTFPGVTGIVIGHNDRIAWGVTNVGPDVQDLYSEEIQGNRYKFKETWEDVQIAEEPIKVKDVVSETLRVQITRHGPIMTPVLSGVTAPVALQWTALRERSRLFESVLRINRAKNWNEFREALRLWDVPSQNFVYADVEGNIGYQTPGNIPIRAKGNGAFPVSGASGEFEWTGYIPFDELPFVYNPPTHFIATANNAVVPPTYKYFIATDWAAPYRQQRIVELLQAKEKHSIDDMATLLGDVYSIPLAQLKKHSGALKPAGLLQERALEYVKTWDGHLTTESVGGFILEATYQRLIRNILTGRLEGALRRDYLNGASNQHRMLVLTLLDQPTSDWWGSAGRDALLQKSFAEAVEELRNQYGDAPAEWKWGKAHTSTFAHPLGSIAPLDRLFNAGPVATPGGVFTVFATGFRTTAPYTVNHVTSMRMIVDLANFGNSRLVQTTGQSGQALHKHYSDMVLLWRDTRFVPMHFDRAAIDRAREGVLVLVP